MEFKLNQMKFYRVVNFSKKVRRVLFSKLENFYEKNKESFSGVFALSLMFLINPKSPIARIYRLEKIPSELILPYLRECILLHPSYFVFWERFHQEGGCLSNELKSVLGEVLENPETSARFRKLACFWGLGPQVTISSSGCGKSDSIFLRWVMKELPEDFSLYYSVSYRNAVNNKKRNAYGI